MKVTKAVGSEGETYSEIDLELPEGTPETIKKKVRRDVGDYLVEQVLSHVAESRSPVKGETFPALSKEYRRKKLAEGGTGKPDLTNEGSMMDDVTYRDAGDDKIKLGIFSSQAWKADGHVKFSGADNGIPKRRFLPDEGQTFKPEIEAEVEKIIADNVVEAAIDPEDFEDVTSSDELYSKLKAVMFPGMGRAEIRAAILRSTQLAEMFEELDMLDLL